MTTAAGPAVETLISTDPFDGTELGQVPVTTPDAIPGVIATARAAQPAWAELPIQDRLDALRPLAAAVEANKDELATLMSREQGKPVAEAGWELAAISGGLERELAEVEQAVAPVTLEDDSFVSTVLRDPLGICAAITPWNFPVLMPHWMVLPALAVGNAVILKPSELTPLSAQAYADLLLPLVPEGVLQVVHGADGPGKALVAGDVDLIAFTGSRDAGRHIMRSAADGLKRLILELGSKDPMIVLRDADVDAAAQFAAHNSFRNCGQVCVSTERIYVEQAIAEPFLAKLNEHAQAMTIGRGTDEGTQMGPMVDARQRRHVLQQIDDAIAKGATVTAGGEPGEGCVMPPTVLTGVTHDMDVCRVETFGPIAAVQVVPDESAAVAQANDTELGLGAVVFAEPDHAERVARKLQAGMVGINKSIGGAEGSPWVGMKQSGYGFHQGVDGHRHFTQTRVISKAK